MIKIVLEQLRVKHYIKNLLVFLPIFFSLNIFKFDLLIKVIYLFIGFCASSSFVYIVNDIVDLEHDKLHPEKKKRPLAKGLITKKQGAYLSFVCLIISVGFALLTSGDCWMFLLSYIVLNLFYSVKFKNYPIIDVSCIVIGFLLRVIAGGFILDINVSSWLILTIMTGSFYLGFGKRRNEFFVNDGDISTRKVLVSYTKGFLDKAMNTSLSLTIAFYSLWSIDAEVVKKLGTDKLFWTVLLVIIGLLRYSLIIENKIDGDPVTVIYGDKVLKVIFGMYVILLVSLIYIA